MLQEVLAKLGRQNTDITGGQESALANLNSAAAGIPNFGASSSEAIKNLFSSSTAPQVGMLTDAYKTLQGNLGGVASGAQLDPYSTPGFSDAISRMTKDITNNTKAVYAGSGRDPSGAGSFSGTLGRGLTEGIAPVIANQYNQNAGRMDQANNALFGGAGATAGGITGQQQTPLMNAMQAMGMLPQATGAALLPGQAQLGAANAQFQQPWTNLQSLLGPLTGIAGLGGQSTGTGTSTTTQPQNTLSNVLGGAMGSAGILSMMGGTGGGMAALAPLLALSDERAKTDIESIGMLNDGQNVIRFKYRGEPKVHIGLLAQEVEDFAPDAVHKIGGMLAVEHGRATDRAAELGRAA